MLLEPSSEKVQVLLDHPTPTEILGKARAKGGVRELTGFFASGVRNEDILQHIVQPLPRVQVRPFT